MLEREKFALDMEFVALFLLLGFSSCLTNAHQHESDVIIVGAGLAGLAAGKYFHEQNVTFKILEANDYLGGRVKNEIWLNESIPLGAGWIHNVNENHIIQKLAVKYGLKYYNDSYLLSNVQYRNLKGQIYSDKNVTKNRARLFTAIDSLESLIEGRMEAGRGGINLKSGLRWAGYVPKTPLDNAIDFWTFNFENGIEPDVIDAVAFGYTKQDAGVEERIVTDERGYIYPVVHEAQAYIDKIKQNKSVTEINQGSDKMYTVKCSDNTEYKAKKVLVTVSTGVLLAKTIKFTPALPSWKIEALNMAPMCHYCKLFFTFSNVFWDNSKGYFMVASERKGHFVHWQNFNINGMFPGSKMLLATLTGDICEESYTYTEDEIKDQAFNVLKGVFKNATRPTSILRNTFSIDPNFRGSYSYQIAGINEDDYRAMEHPVRQSLYFAGEAYQRWEFGYAHGAYENGHKAAQNMTKCLKNTEHCATDAPLFVMKKDCPTAAGLSVKENIMVVFFFNFISLYIFL